MNRIRLISEFLNKGMLKQAYKVAYNYYSKSELYKGDILKTLLLIDDFNHQKASLKDIKRSIRVIEDDKSDLLGYNKELQKYNDNFEKAIVNFA